MRWPCHGALQLNLGEIIHSFTRSSESFSAPSQLETCARKEDMLDAVEIEKRVEMDASRDVQPQTRRL